MQDDINIREKNEEEGNDIVNIEKKAEEFLRVFRKGEEFTQALLKENERLRYKVVLLEEKLKNSNGNTGVTLEAEKIKLENQVLLKEKNELLAKMEEVAKENKDFVDRYLEVEEENNNLANLYVASYQLHSTLNFDEVIRIVLEIIINLVGGEKFSIMLFKDDTTELVTVASEGMDDLKKKVIKKGEGIIGNVAETGDSYYADDLGNSSSLDLDNPIVCIPLQIQEHIIGVICIYALLEQKNKKLSRIDYELFSMLAGHAATAVFSSKLYSISERKLTTIKGFIELLSNKKQH